MTGWKATTLGDHLRIKHGFAFKGAHFTSDGPEIVLTPGNFAPSNGFVRRPEKDRSYCASFPNEFCLKAGDLLVAMTDLTQEARILGAAMRVPANTPCLHNQRLGLVQEVSEEIDRRFLYHLFGWSAYRQCLKGSATGSTVRHTSPSRIYEFQFLLPELETQRRIAGILSAYDDLIALNERRIAVLEETARRVFERWFARPNMQSDLQSFTQLISRGIAPKYDEDANTIVINQKCIRNGRLNLSLARSQSKVPKPEKLVQAGDVLVNSTGVGTLGRVAQAWTVPDGTTVDSHVTIVRSKEPSDAVWLGRLLIGLQTEIEAMAMGATGQTELSQERLGALSVVSPPTAERRRYGETTKPMIELVELLARQNANLRATSDLLLPRLVSGEIDVSEAPALAIAAE